MVCFLSPPWNRYTMENDDMRASRWKDRKALRTRMLSKKARSEESDETAASGTDGRLVVYSPEAAKSHGEVGILADVNYPFYSILYEGEFVQGKAGRGEQGDILKLLVVGDDVVFEHLENGIKINGILERRSKIAKLHTDPTRSLEHHSTEKIIAANIDMGVIVASATQPQFRPGLIDRYLVLCEYGNVKPLLCITKTDLAEAPDLSMYKGSDIPVVEVSNKTKKGIEKLKAYLLGKSCVFIGVTGVGKSSLINTIFGEEILEVGDISRKSGMGMHTTSTTSLHIFEGSTMLIDTPGIRSLSLGNIDADLLRSYFPEFQEYSADCEFSDCTHSHEPKCAVKNAVEDGKISKLRYDRYIRILNDIRTIPRRGSIP